MLIQDWRPQGKEKSWNEQLVKIIWNFELFPPEATLSPFVMLYLNGIIQFPAYNLLDVYIRNMLKAQQASKSVMFWRVKSWQW